uniref:Uncharacterized protein n=1 Tax=Glossina palpalis gambiensis TaxID=67801 RepID=A0A1B0BMH9_9MUSC
MTTSDEMGTFCHDHIEHPLLWCEDKKRLIERKNAEESLRMWRRRKAEELARKEREKQEYYDLFLKHCPWGRPGGGAPNVDIRRKDIAELGLHSTAPVNTGSHRYNSINPCRLSDYFTKHKKCLDPVTLYQPTLLSHNHRHHHHHHHHHSMPRVGAHSYTVEHTNDDAKADSTLTLCERDVETTADDKNAERLQITLKDHPSMSFRNKGHLDIEVRYKPTAVAVAKGKPVLEKIVVTENDKCPLLEKNEDKTRSESKLNKTKKNLEKLEKSAGKDPWGKPGPGGKPWRSPKAVGSTFMKSLGWTNKEMLKELDQDNPVTPAEKPTFRKSRAAKKSIKCCDLCTCPCPAISLTSHPLKPLKKSNPNKISENKSKICARLMRHSHNNKVNDTTTDQSAKMMTTNASCVGNNGVELVPLLARRRAYNRPISLSSTDITKRTTSNDRFNTADAELRYKHELNEQISQKRRSISMAQQLDKDMCNRHFVVFDTFWGRPGHGAPGADKRKLKLNRLLYGSPECTPLLQRTSYSNDIHI